MKIVLRQLAVMLAMMTAMIAGTAVAASAAASDCGPGLACIWSGPQWTGTRYTISVSAYGINRCNILGAAWHKDVSWKVGFGSGLVLGGYTGVNNCTTGLVASWGPNRMGVLSPTLDGGPSGAYQNVGAVIIE